MIICPCQKVLLFVLSFVSNAISVKLSIPSKTIKTFFLNQASRNTLVILEFTIIASVGADLYLIKRNLFVYIHEKIAFNSVCL